jgi:predicted MFS family arabinose efflux permease
MNSHLERMKVLTGGILSLVLLLGIARFAYTPMLPVMQDQADLGISEAGWLASINYIGYLCGAIIASRIKDLMVKDRLYRIGLVVALLTTVLMALTNNVWLWAISRFFAGLSSAAGLLLGSGLILNWLMRNGHRSELGIHFAGIGLGIAFCSAAVELMNQYMDWSQMWYALAIIGAVIMIPAWRWLPAPDSFNATKLEDNPPSKTFLRLFMIAYFCAGVGYVVSATFIVAIVDQLPGLEGKGSLSFIILGLAAAPACIFWDLIARKVGYLNALIAASIIQIIGIMLPLIEPSLTFTLAGAALFGGTFIGIVSLVLTMAGRYYPSHPATMMGKMTISYGFAQIIAPAVTGVLAEYSGNYSDGLYLAGTMMLICTVLLLKIKHVERRDFEQKAA